MYKLPFEKSKDISKLLKIQKFDKNGKKTTVYVSPEFQKWFGSSKVVDEQGNPKMVFHGSNSEFDTFDEKFNDSASGYNVYKSGFCFSDSKAFVEHEKFGKNISGYYLKIKKPFIAGKNKLDYNKFCQKYYSGAPNHTVNYVKEKLSTLGGTLSILTGIARDKNIKVSEIFTSFGFDGIQDGHVFVAFDPDQIRKA
jgi:hypothetical protein